MCSVLKLLLQQSNWLWLTHTPSNGLHDQRCSIALLFCCHGCVCLLFIYAVLLMMLGCLLPCANPAGGRQLKGHTQALWIAPITANGNMIRRSSRPYLHTSVHLSSVRSLGNRSSEPGLPPPYTADCTDHFLRNKNTSSMTTAIPPWQSFIHNVLNLSSLCCFSAVLVIQCPVVYYHMALLVPAFTPSHWSWFPAGKRKAPLMS